MNSLLRHQRMRITAIAVLFVWLLTLGAGIANACLLHGEHAHGGHISYGGAALAASAHAVSGARYAVQASAALGAADQELSSHATTCASLRVAVQTGVAAPKAWKVADLQADAVLAPVPWETTQLADHAGGPTKPEDPVWLPLPAFIRFLRLTL